MTRVKKQKTYETHLAKISIRASYVGNIKSSLVIQLESHESTHRTYEANVIMIQNVLHKTYSWDHTGLYL